MKKKMIILSFIFTITILLTSCRRKDFILIYSTQEEERIEFIQEKLYNKFPNYDIVIEYSGTGALVSRLQGEEKYTECDIVYELECANLEIVMNSVPNIFSDLDDYDFDIYDESVLGYNHKKYAIENRTWGGVIYNKKLLKERGLEIPETYNDLLDPKYEGLISMPNPKSSGTGYLFYNGLVSEYGTDKALSYFDKLDKNIKEYTTSGSVPIKSVDRGEIAIGFAMLWQCVEYKNKNKDLDYTFLDLGAPYNLYGMGIVEGHASPQVKEVFEYIFYELNKEAVDAFVPDKIYKEQSPKVPNYPENVVSIQMKGVFDPKYKQNLLDLWRN